MDTPPSVTPNPSPVHLLSSEQNHNNKAPPNRPAPPRPAPVNNVSSAPPPVYGQTAAADTQKQPVHIPPQASSYDQIPAGGGGGLFSSIRGGAGSFLKNLKDTSSKVMQTMQQTIARTDLDISAITSRILVMPCPSEGLESAYKTNNIEDVKLYIESRFSPAKVSIYNLGSRTCARLPPPVRTVEGSYLYPLSMKAPSLQGMYSMAEDMFGFLSLDPKSVIFIQSSDSGRATAATMVNNFLLFQLSSFNRFFIDLCSSNLCWTCNRTRRCNANFCC